MSTMTMETAAWVPPHERPLGMRIAYHLGTLLLWTLTLGFLGFVTMIIVPAC